MIDAPTTIKEFEFEPGMSFGKRLKHMREQREFSIRELCEYGQLQMSRTTLSNFETGKYPNSHISAYDLYLLSIIFGFSMDEFLEDLYA